MSSVPTVSAEDLRCTQTALARWLSANEVSGAVEAFVRQSLRIMDMKETM